VLSNWLCIAEAIQHDALLYAFSFCPANFSDIQRHHAIYAYALLELGFGPFHLELLVPAAPAGVLEPGGLAVVLEPGALAVVLNTLISVGRGVFFQFSKASYSIIYILFLSFKFLDLKVI
jgi:hypothetical protein